MAEAVKPVEVVVYWKRRDQPINQWSVGARRTLNYARDEDTGVSGTQNFLFIDNIPHDPDSETINVTKVDLGPDNTTPTPPVPVLSPYNVTLSGAIGTGDTAITVSALGKAADFPNNSWVRIDNEYMEITAGGGTTSWTVVRAIHGSTAATHSDGAEVRRVLLSTGPHKDIVLAADPTALDPPVLSLTTLANGFQITFTAPSDAKNRLEKYNLYRSIDSAGASDFYTEVPATSNKNPKFNAEVTNSESATSTYYFRAKSVTKSGVESSTFSNEVSGVPGIIGTAFLQKNAQTFFTTVEFSAVDNDTVQWTAGDLTFADGNSYSIASGNTGNMTALTLIWFDPDVSTTVLQVTGISGPFQPNVNAAILAVAKNVADAAQDAYFYPLVGVLGINETIIGDNSISTSKIQALAITAAKIAANTITSAQITTGVLTGLLIQTTAGGTIRSASSGARTQIDSSGLSLINASGTTMVHAPSSGTYAGDILLLQSDATPGGLRFGSGITSSPTIKAELFMQVAGNEMELRPTSDQTGSLFLGRNASSKNWENIYLHVQGTSTVSTGLIDLYSRRSDDKFYSWLQLQHEKLQLGCYESAGTNDTYLQVETDITDNTISFVVDDGTYIDITTARTRLAHILEISSTQEIRWGSTGPEIGQGAGTPEGSRTAPVGSLYLRNDGGASTTLYVKESGSGNTGWVAK